MENVLTNSTLFIILCVLTSFIEVVDSCYLSTEDAIYKLMYMQQHLGYSRSLLRTVVSSYLVHAVQEFDC